jgi:hypothetical protein
MNISEGTKSDALQSYVASAISSPEAIHEAVSYISAHNWDNVSRHCLLEAARACIFADLLRFDVRLKRDLVFASLLHDGHKQREIEAMREEIAHGGSGQSASNKAVEAYLDELRSRGVARRTVEFIGLIGGLPEVLARVMAIAEKVNQNDEEVAALVAHYIDSYTRNDEWVQAAQSEAGVRINDLDRRMRNNRRNSNYQKGNEEVRQELLRHPLFSGMDCFGAMAYVGHRIEERFSALIAARSSRVIAPLDLPEVIDISVRAEVGVS